MKRITHSILLLTIAVNICLPATAQTSEAKAVKQSFDNYKSAILNDKGDEAVNYVDSRTIAYYSDMLEKAKKADSAMVNSFSILDKLMILTIRHRTSKEDLLSFDGKSMLVYCIKKGMVGKNSVANNSIGDVTIEGNFAKGQLLVRDQTTPISFHFYKEEGSWKIDLTSLFAVTITAFKKLAEDSGQPENEYLFTLLERVSGKKPGPEIWLPVQ